MLPSFDFSTSSRIVFGAGRARELLGLTLEFGSRVLLVTGKTKNRHPAVLTPLQERGTIAAHVFCEGEPSTEDALHAVQVGRKSQVDIVLAVGGGSAIDLAKAVAALIQNPGEPLDYLEVVGLGRPLTVPSLPVIAVPTTAGTGAEVTKNAVLSSKAHSVKVSLRGEGLLPKVALIDPELALSLPREVTASTGFDALVQVIEPFLSCKANPMTDALCRDGIRLGAQALPRLWSNPSDIAARSDMALTSLYGGMALANAKLGAVHGFAAPLGGMFAAPHGALCAALLPAVLQVNLRALRERAKDSPVLPRFDELGRLLTGRIDAKAEDAIAFCAALKTQLGIVELGRLGVDPKQSPAILGKAARASSMQGNPLVLTESELAEILSDSM